MDLSSQSNSNYVNSNGLNNFGISNNASSNIHLNNNSNTTNNIKSVLTSPIHQLRVLHQNKRSPTASMFSPSNLTSSTGAFIVTPMLIPPSISNSHLNNNSGYANNNSNNNNSNVYYDNYNYRNSHIPTTTTSLPLSSSSSPTMIEMTSNSHPTTTTTTASDTIIPSSSTVVNNASSINSSRSLGHHNNGFGNDDRVPCVLTDDDRIPHSAQILADRYLLLNQIAGSSFFECVDIRTGEALTCKAIGNCYSKILSAYFRMDGDPHIKPLHKLLQASDQTYLLLPPSLYGDLHSYVRERKRLRETEARHLFRQICKTVKSCHQQGIVLRDLKLRKFVFSDCDRTHLKFESLEDAVVLEDPDDDILKEKIGCPAYVAPEILKPNSDFSGKAADLWSLGVILYTMLVGRYPFNDPEHSSLFAKIARCQFTIPDYLSSKARCLIKSLLQKVPKHRITSDDVLYHPWLQEDNNSTIFNNSCSSNSSLMNSSDLSNDDQRVPELDCLELT